MTNNRRHGNSLKFTWYLANGLWLAIAFTLIPLVVILLDASRREAGKALLKAVWSWNWYFEGREV